MLGSDFKISMLFTEEAQIGGAEHEARSQVSPSGAAVEGKGMCCSSAEP